ncbi:uncharacterized protein LOC124159427 [Ischnura elegans]|uniref:uncharacterized protein LOC124159427 n=1 Tax=Ischnura elegans TaxID=197161 RepID=UPI001ED887C7|nr:uncharacterized protein LOC124159427 [Ischnura elegans]
MEIFQVLLAVILFIPIILRLLLKFIVWSCKTALNLDVEIEGLMLLGLRGIKIFLPQYTLDISTLYLLFPGEGREKFRICVQGLSVVKSIRAPVIRSTSNDACQGEEVKQLSPCRLHEISKWFELEILDLNIGSELSGQHSLTSCTSKVVLRLHHSEGSQIFAADANLYTTTFAIYSDPVASVSSVGFRGDSHTSSHKLILQWNTSIKAEASITEDSFSMEKLSIDISGLDVVIKENLADLMSRKYHHVKTANAQPMPERSLECIVRSLSPYIPKDFHFGIQNIEMSGMKGSMSPYTVSIHKCSLELTDIMADSGEEEIALNPKLSAAFCVSDVEMEINLLDCVKIGNISVSSNLKNRVLNTDVMLKSFDIVYHHQELMNWLKINFKKLSLNEEAVPSGGDNSSKVNGLTYRKKGARYPVTMKERLKEITPYSQDSNNNSTIGSEFLEWLSEASVVIQMSRLTAQFFLSPRESVETLSFDLDYTKLKYEKSQGSSTDQLALEEVIMKNLWCHLGKMPIDQIFRKEKYHIWGTPLFVELLSVKYPKPGNSTPLPVHILLSSVQMEWTPCLPPVALEALRRLLELEKALSSKSNQPLQRVQNDRRERCSSSSCQSSSIKLTMLDCNVYLMDGLSTKGFKKEDLCYMLRFDTTEYHSSSELLSFNVDGFKAITILENRVGQHACARSVDLKGYWLYVKSLKGASHYPFGEITVELENKIELFWSQELHSRVSSMNASVQEFLKSLWETYYCGHRRNGRNADPWSMTIKANCPARVVLDVFQTTTVHVFFSKASYLSTDRGRCIRASIYELDFLKGAFLGVNMASFGALYNQLSQGYIYHKESETAIYLSIDSKLMDYLTKVVLCELCYMFLMLL